jgi:hypothetical protein
MVVLIACFATSFSEVPDPYPIVDLLIENWRLFIDTCAGAELVATLFYLCSSFDEYRENRVAKCCEIFCASLRLGDVKALRQMYSALCFYYLEGTAIDYSVIASHLVDKRITEYVLTFLLKLKRIEATDELISTLLSVAHDDVRATLLLIHLARKLAFARLICEDHLWVAEEMPTAGDTLRLFLMVFRHPELRKEISTWPEIATFFVNICRQEDSELLAAIALMIRKIGVTKRFLDNLTRLGTLKAIFETVKLRGDELSIKAGLVIMEALGKVGFASEYLMLSNEIKHQLTLQNSISALAVVVLSILSKYEECRSKYVEMDLVPYFEELLKTDAYRERAQVFLRSVREC